MIWCVLSSFSKAISMLFTETTKSFSCAFLITIYIKCRIPQSFTFQSQLHSAIHHFSCRYLSLLLCCHEPILPPDIIKVYVLLSVSVMNGQHKYLQCKGHAQGAAAHGYHLQPSKYLKVLQAASNCTSRLKITFQVTVLPVI